MSGHGNKPTERGALTNWRQQRDLSGHGKKPTERGELTSWGRQRKGLVKTWKETDRKRGTHQLEMEERGTCQDTEINQPSERHSRPGGDLSGRAKKPAEKGRSPPGDGRGRDLSGCGGKPTEQGEPTSWRRQREGLVKTWKQTNLRDSQTGDGRRDDLSGHGNKPTERGALTSWRRQRGGLVRTLKEIDRVRGTHFLEMQKEGLFRTWNEANRARGTHFLGTAEEGSCQDTERN